MNKPDFFNFFDLTISAKIIFDELLDKTICYASNGFKDKYYY